jgi:CDP-4-dehydro-6-deoxyglucose reductase
VPTVYLVKSGVTFEAAPDETIMEAAARANIFLAHNCLSGICRACMTRVLSGTVEHDPEYAADLNIDSSEIAEGYRLLCNSFARTDVELER